MKHIWVEEISSLSLWCAIAFSALQGLTGWGKGFTQSSVWISLTQKFSYLQTFFAVLAWGLFVYHHLTLDFSFVSVLAHTSRHLPLLYRVGATWTSSEGSLLLWCTMLSCWGSLSAYRLASSPESARMCSLLGLLTLSFWILLLGWFDPFITLSHQVSEGLGLNPLLHDISLLIHPLFLYAGYTSLVIPFCSSLISNTPLKPWLRLSWTLLTTGLLTGSLWAYYELGWGGWWFWDPVENVALLPWLLLSAALHVKKQASLHPLTAFLTVSAFIFVLFGSACMRAGLFTSVHTFTALPSRTLPLLVLASFWSVSSLIVSLKRLSPLFTHTPFFSLLPLKRWLPILVLSSIACIVAIGTFLPLAFKSSVHLDAAFYNQTSFLLILIPFFLMPLLSSGFIQQHWKSGVAFIGILLSVLGLFYSFSSLKTVLCLGLSLWITLGSLPLFRLRSHWPQALAHMGVGVCLLGITLASFWKIEVSCPLKVRETCTLGPYTLIFQDLQFQSGPLFDCEKAHIILTHPRASPLSLYPERRLYHTSQLLTSETAFSSHVLQDFYVVLSDFVGQETWLIYAILYPGLWTIWGGGLLLIIAGLIALLFTKRSVKPQKKSA